MKTNELICDKCRKKFSGEKVDAEKIFICGLCSGLDIAGDPTRWRPSLGTEIKFTIDEANLMVEALNLLGLGDVTLKKKNACVELMWKLQQVKEQK